MPRPALSAVPTNKPHTATVDDLWLRIEQLILPALAQKTFERFFDQSRLNIGRFNSLMAALAELLSDEEDILTPEDLASDVAETDEDMAEAIIVSCGAMRRALAVRERLFGDRPLDEVRGEGGPLHLLSSYGTWHGWLLVSVAVALRNRVTIDTALRPGILNLMQETARGAYVVIRTLEIARSPSESNGKAAEERVEPDAEAELLEHEAHLQAEEALLEAERTGR